MCSQKIECGLTSIAVCERKNLCVDCDDKTCFAAGIIESDCPKVTCQSDDCENCEFIKEYQKKILAKRENNYEQNK